MLRIQGSIVAIVTPFHQDGSVNFSKLGELVDWQIQTGPTGSWPWGPPVNPPP